MTALGKLMTLFLHEENRGRYNIPHTLMHLDVVVRRERWGQGSWSFFFSTSQLDYCVISHRDTVRPTACFKKVGSKWMT